LPGASFVVNGAARASGSALATASAELKPTKDALAGTRRAQVFVRDSPQFVTELIQSSVSSVTNGAVDEFGMAGGAVKFPVKFPGLVKSPGLVVEPVDAGERHQHRGLVPAV
jgi:hypothetical protein